MAPNETTRPVIGGHVVCTFPDADGKLTMSYRLGHWKLRWWIFTTMLKFLFSGRIVDASEPLEFTPDRIPDPRPVEFGRHPPSRPEPSLDYLSGSRYVGPSWQLSQDRSEWVAAYDIPSAYLNWPSHVYTSPRSGMMAVLDALDSVEFEPTDILLAGQTLYFRSVALKDQIVPPEFDRRKPLYRLFQEEGYRHRLYTVLPDNTPGDEVAPSVAQMIQIMVGTRPWGHHFWSAFAQHGKATIYAGQGIPNLEQLALLERIDIGQALKDMGA